MLRAYEEVLVAHLYHGLNETQSGTQPTPGLEGPVSRRKTSQEKAA